jgi:hypothetical protein
MSVLMASDLMDDPIKGNFNILKWRINDARHDVGAGAVHYMS